MHSDQNITPSPDAKSPSAASLSSQKGDAEKDFIQPLDLTKDVRPRSAVAPGHIPAAEIAFAEQIRAELDAELGLKPASQTASSLPPFKGGRHKEVVVPLPDADFNAMLQKVCYDNATRLFWKHNSAGTWVSLGQRDLVLHLLREGMPNRPADGERLSQAEEFVVRAQNERCIEMRTAIGGYRTGVKDFGDIRILVPTEPKFLVPAQGNWSMLEGILINMFKEEQLPYVYGWIKVALDMFRQQSYMPGQVLVLCGEREAGKNLFTRLVKELFGGRLPGKPYSYMTQGTDFNSDFIGKELLTIEDEVSLTSFTARRAFGAKIKDLTVNDVQRLHRKGAEAVSVQPLQRLIISLNDEPERMQILPTLDPDIEDKIMLIKMFRHKMPKETSTAMERKAFEEELLAQLPAFLDFLDGWQIPSHLVVSRFGISHYHHPELVDALQAQSPEKHLLRLIDEVLFPAGPESDNWVGMTNELDRRLKSTAMASVAREASELLKGNVQCGTYLGRLANQYPKRVRRLTKNGGSQKWMIKPPFCEDEDGEESILSPAPKRASKPDDLAKLRERLANYIAVREASLPAAEAAISQTGEEVPQAGSAIQEMGAGQCVSNEKLPSAKKCEPMIQVCTADSGRSAAAQDAALEAGGTDSAKESPAQV